MLAEIKQCYIELDKFWARESSGAFEALKMRRVDPTDLERWKNYYKVLEQTIESWKVQCGFLFMCCALLTDQNTLFRMSLQVVMLRPSAATMNTRLMFARSRFHFGISLIDCA